MSLSLLKYWPVIGQLGSIFTDQFDLRHNPISLVIQSADSDVALSRHLTFLATEARMAFPRVWSTCTLS